MQVRGGEYAFVVLAVAFLPEHELEEPRVCEREVDVDDAELHQCFF